MSNIDSQFGRFIKFAGLSSIFGMFGGVAFGYSNNFNDVDVCGIVGGIIGFILGCALIKIQIKFYK